MLVISCELFTQLHLFLLSLCVKFSVTYFSVILWALFTQLHLFPLFLRVKFYLKLFHGSYCPVIWWELFKQLCLFHLSLCVKFCVSYFTGVIAQSISTTTLHYPLHLHFPTQLFVMRWETELTHGDRTHSCQLPLSEWAWTVFFRWRTAFIWAWSAASPTAARLSWIQHTAQNMQCLLWSWRIHSSYFTSATGLEKNIFWASLKMVPWNPSLRESLNQRC